MKQETKNLIWLSGGAVVVYTLGLFVGWVIWGQS